MRIGIDTGGTFTDLVAYDQATGRLVTSKSPSVPAQPHNAVLDVIGQAGVVAADDLAITLGTTIATNARLTRTGASVLYVTTRGFEDIPFIQWAARKEAYDVTWKKPDPGVRRRHCFGVEERIDKNGAVRIALSDEALAELAAALESAMCRLTQRRSGLSR